MWRKPKYKIGQQVYAYIRKEQTIIKGHIKTVYDNHEYEISIPYSYVTYDNIDERVITKTIGQMVRKVLSKEYIYAKVLDDYLKNHLVKVEENNE